MPPEVRKTYPEVDFPSSQFEKAVSENPWKRFSLLFSSWDAQ
jgi:hypothetical protein